MNAALGVLSGAIIIVGGIYLIRKTNAVKIIREKAKILQENMKNSFMEGYAEVAKAK